ncbi:hypothetical protein JT306_23430 [Salmonella enterica subsp. enterica serovar Kentucky]|nr:hypothetical protein [Salmonella enterica subsp. enterica serovar Kentucky]
MQGTRPSALSAVLTRRFIRWRGEHYGCVTESRLWRFIPAGAGTHRFTDESWRKRRFIPAGAGTRE